MISRLKGTLVARDTDRVEVETPGGVVYEVEVPLSVLQRLPSPGAAVELRTLQVVREDAVRLYGFLEADERELFQRLMGAQRVGAAKALAMLSTFSAPRLARALAEKDVAALSQVSGIGRKTAERVILDLSDKVADLAVAGAPEDAGPQGRMARDAVAALVALGYSFVDADEAVRGVVEAGGAASADELIRKALGRRQGS